MWINPLGLANCKTFNLEKELGKYASDQSLRNMIKMKPEGISVSIENSCRGIAIDTRSTKYI